MAKERKADGQGRRGLFKRFESNPGCKGGLKVWPLPETKRGQGTKPTDGKGIQDLTGISLVNKLSDRDYSNQRDGESLFRQTVG